MKPPRILSSLALPLAGPLVLLQAGTARAADCTAVALGAIPSCAVPCFVNNVPSIGCGGTDFACQCAQEARLYAAVEGCVATGCPAASHQAVIDGASSVCNCALGPGSVPMTVSGSVVPGSFVSGMTVIPVTKTVSTTGTGASPTSSSTGGGGGGGKPIPTPTMPSITTATNASSGAEHQVTFQSGLLGSAIAATLLAVLAW